MKNLGAGHFEPFCAPCSRLINQQAALCRMLVLVRFFSLLSSRRCDIILKNKTKCIAQLSYRQREEAAVKKGDAFGAHYRAWTKSYTLDHGTAYAIWQKIYRQLELQQSISPIKPRCEVNKDDKNRTGKITTAKIRQ